MWLGSDMTGTTDVSITTASTTASVTFSSDFEDPATGVREPRRPILPLLPGAIALEEPTS